jgi:glycosyltransferase involved in cell wall biosynthesis
LVQDVRDRGLSARVRFLGERWDVPALLAESDLFVLPSRSEASPNAVLEAMASGLPIVATRVGGIPDLIHAGVTGALVAPDDPSSLAESVIDLINRPAVAFAFGAAARREAERRFSFDRMVAAFEQLYLSQLDRRAVRAEAGPELAAS